MLNNSLKPSTARVVTTKVAFSPYCVFICCMYFAQQITINCPYRIHPLAGIMEAHSVLSEAGSECLYCIHWGKVLFFRWLIVIKLFKIFLQLASLATPVVQVNFIFFTWAVNCAQSKISNSDNNQCSVNSGLKGTVTPISSITGLLLWSFRAVCCLCDPASPVQRCKQPTRCNNFFVY